MPATRQVTVGEVLRGLENSLDLVECFQPAGRHCPLTGVCRLAPLLHRAREAFFRELDTTTLGELLVSPRDSAAFLGVQINTQFSP